MAFNANPHSPSARQTARAALLLAVAASLPVLVACESRQAQTIAPHAAAKTFSDAALLQGVASNGQGTVKTGELSLLDGQNHILASAPLNNGHYQLAVPANTPLPVLLSLTVGGGTLLAAIVDPSVTRYDINPLTTAIAKKAKALGGYTRANMIVAAESTINAPEANKTSTGFKGDPTTQYGGWH